MVTGHTLGNYSTHNPTCERLIKTYPTNAYQNASYGRIQGPGASIIGLLGESRLRW